MKPNTSSSPAEPLPQESDDHKYRRVRGKQKDPLTVKALAKIHEKLRDKSQLLKLHLKHYHMKIEAFKRRTSHLQIPKDIYDLYETVCKECSTCANLKDKPSRSKVSGLRSEIFGELLFLDHGDINIGDFTFTFLIVLDACTGLIMGYPAESKGEDETQESLREFLHHMQVSPRKICADSAFMTPKWERFYTTHDISPFQLGAYTPWPNRAEASVRVFKRHIYQLVMDLSKDPIRKVLSIRTLLREACWARNVSCTYGGKTPIELALGRRPPDVVTLENANPGQLSSEPLQPDDVINQVRTKALKSYLEARQSVDLRKDLASSLRFVSGPFSEGEMVWYYQVDGNKIKNGRKIGSWIKAEVRSPQKGSMVIISLGTRVVEVNQSLLRREYDFLEHIDIPLSDTTAQSAPRSVPPSVGVPSPGNSSSSSSSVPPGPEDEVLIEDGSASYAHALWQSITKGKIDFLELFAGSARLSQASSINGLSVGSPIDLRTGFDLNSRKGQQKAMQIILDQKPEIIHMAPLCSPWSPWSNMKDEHTRWEDRKKAMPMVRFCAQVALHQIKHGRKFIIENPKDSAIWKVHCFLDLMALAGVTYGTLDFCAFWDA